MDLNDFRDFKGLDTLNMLGEIDNLPISLASLINLA